MHSELEIVADDGHQWTADLYRPANARALLVYQAAMGVEAGYYRPLAEALAGHSIAVLVSDLRGIGTSSARASRKVDFGYRELCEQDLPAALSAARDAVPALPVFVGGHSLGGQAACLYAAGHAHELAGLVLTAACSVHYKGFAGRNGHGARVAGYLFPALAKIVGHFPGTTLRFGKREARRLMSDWGHIARTGLYRPLGATANYEELMHRCELDVLALSMADDRWAPKAAVDGLLGKMPRAQTTHLHLSRGDLGVQTDHFRWVRTPSVPAQRIATWIDERLD